MYLGEIPKNENVVLGFDIGGRHFDFTTGLLPDISREDPAGTVFAEPILIQGSFLHLDERCEKLELRFLNRLSGRTHIWKGIQISYRSDRGEYYVISCGADSVQENRRRAVRIGVDFKSECTMSLLEGKYPCRVADISVTGIGLIIDAELADKNPVRRTVHTHFIDDVLGIDFQVVAKCLYVSRINTRKARCGCEILSVNPSINEYINLRQTHRLAKLNAVDREELMKEITGLKKEDLPGKEREDAGDGAWIPAEVLDGIQALPEKKIPFDEGMQEGGLCPICETGRLHLFDGGFECDECGSILEDASGRGKRPEGGLCPICEKGHLHPFEGGFECDECGSILEEVPQFGKKQGAGENPPPKTGEFREGDLCPVCEAGRLHFNQGGFECDHCGSILE